MLITKSQWEKKYGNANCMTKFAFHYADVSSSYESLRIWTDPSAHMVIMDLGTGKASAAVYNYEMNYDSVCNGILTVMFDRGLELC